MSLDNRQNTTVVRRSGSFVGPLLLIVLLVAVLGGGGYFVLRLRDASKAEPPPPPVVAAKADASDAPPAPTVEAKPAEPAEPPDAIAAKPEEAKPAEPERPAAPPPAVDAKPAQPPAPTAPASPPKETVMPADEQLAKAQALIEEGAMPEAKLLLQPLVEAKLPVAQRILGLMMLTEGDAVTADPEQGLALLQAAAAQLDGEAQFHLGQAYFDGLGVKRDPVTALAWFMHSAANGYAPAVAARDRGYAGLDDTGRVQAESKSRSLPAPFPAGWLADDETGVEVWSPSWYRNGTFKVKVEAAAVDGKAHGPGKVILTATLYGRSDRTWEGTFHNGVMMDEALAARPPELIATDEMIHPLDPADAGVVGIERLWRQAEIGGLAIQLCAAKNAFVYVVMTPDFAGLQDDDMKAVGIGAMQALARLCPLREHFQARVRLLPQDYEAAFDRGDTVYGPQLAEVYVYVNRGAASADEWSIQVKNYALAAHKKRLHDEEQAAKKRARAEKQAREIAAASRREMPDIRGLKLGISFEAFTAALADEAKTWTPELKAERTLPDFAEFVQKVQLKDGAVFTATFASSQNGSQLMVLVYEQTLRNGPTPDELRAQLYAKYGQADDEVGQKSWLTWWLRSGFDGEPKGAFLKGRIRAYRDGPAEYLRLVLNDYNLSRADERMRYNAKLQAEIDKAEKSKSDKPKF